MNHKRFINSEILFIEVHHQESEPEIHRLREICDIYAYIYACLYTHIIDIAYISKKYLIATISKEWQQISKKKINNTMKINSSNKMRKNLSGSFIKENISMDIST